MITDDIFANVEAEKSQGKNIIAVGTTVARTIETLPYLYKAMGGKYNEYFDSLTKDISQHDTEKYILSRKKE